MCYGAEHRQLTFWSWSKHINVDSYLISAGAFLIPYFTNLVFTGLPLFFFELSLGQYARSSPIALWSVIPLFQGKSKASSNFPWTMNHIFPGIGYSMLLIVIGIGLYYNVIIAWIIYYLIEVFISLPSGKLPWTTCGNRWGKKKIEGRLLADIKSSAGTRRTAWTSTQSTQTSLFKQTAVRLQRSSSQGKCWSCPPALNR